MDDGSCKSRPASPAANRPPEGQFRSLDLAGPLGRWNLAGTRAAAWFLEDDSPRFSLSGTTAKIFEIQSRAPGVYRLRVRSAGSPRLQVTVIRQPADWPRFQAAARWELAESPASGQHPALQVQIDGPTKPALKIVRLAVECRRGKHQQSFCLAGNQVSFHTVSAAKGQRVRAVTLHLPERLFPPPDTSSAEWQLKIIAEDNHGRRSACRVDLPVPKSASPAKLLPVAVQPGPRVL